MRDHAIQGKIAIATVVSDLRIDSSRRSLRASRHGIARDAFTSAARFAPRGN